MAGHVAAGRRDACQPARRSPARESGRSRGPYASAVFPVHPRRDWIFRRAAWRCRGISSHRGLWVSWRESAAPRIRPAWWPPRNRGCRTGARIEPRRSCHGARPRTWRTSRRSRHPRNTCAIWPRHSTWRLRAEPRPRARAAGCPADGARIVRRGSARADAARRAVRRPRARHLAGRAAGGVLRMARRARRQVAPSGTRSAISSWYATSAAGPRTSA